MNTRPDPRPDTPDQAAHELARVQKKVDSARALLVRLLQELVVAESLVGRKPPAAMLEANEQLVLASLRHQAEAEAADQGAMQTLSRSVGLDPLTQLPNRALLLDRCAHALASARRRGSRLALLFLDLDQFKPVNDSLGHALGDEVLKTVAQRLTAAVREADTVSRYGGDEFLILLSEVAQPSDAETIAGKLIAAIAEPCRVGGHVLQLSASIGISLYPDDGDDIDLLVHKADNAMYRAKRQGTGSFALHGKLPVGQPQVSDTTPRVEPTRAVPASAAQEQRNAELREANERLVIAALGAQELQAAAIRARQRQDELLALVTQELKNPVAPVRLAAAMLGRPSSAEPLLPRVRSIIEQQAQHIAQLVDAVHDVAHAEEGTLTLEREDIDLVGIVDAAVSGCWASMDARRQKFSAQLPSTAIRLQGDRARLELAVGNLLDNASKYTPDGGEIRLSLEVAGDAAVLTVSDNGIGITAQALPEIFEPFAADTQALGFNGVGRGIGLAVVRALVEAHGGTVHAFSEGSMQGSRFVVTLALPGTNLQA